MTIRDVSDLDQHRQSDGGVFGANALYQADTTALASGRVDAGRLELHRAAEAEMARTGADYESALDVVLARVRLGTVTLSTEALAGTGIDPVTYASRSGLTHDLGTGEVVALPGAPVSASLSLRPEQSTRFLDALGACASLKPGASLDDHRVATAALVRRAGGRMVRDR